MKFNILFIFSCLAWAPAAAPAQAVPDLEPEVASQVADTLEGVADGRPDRERFTDKGASYLAAPGLSAALTNCPRPFALVLLSRSVNGEDRLYVYRAQCRPRALRVAVDFNKAARINRLELAPER